MAAKISRKSTSGASSKGAPTAANKGTKKPLSDRKKVAAKAARNREHTKKKLSNFLNPSWDQTQDKLWEALADWEKLNGTLPGKKSTKARKSRKGDTESRMNGFDFPGALRPKELSELKKLLSELKKHMSDF